MKKLQFLLILLVVGALFIPAVSAEEYLIDEIIGESVSTTTTGTQTPSGGSTAGPVYFQGLQFPDITKVSNLYYITIESDTNEGYWVDNTTYMTDGRHDFTYNFNGESRAGVVYVDRSTNVLGVITKTKFTIFLNDWNTQNLSGTQTIILPFYVGASSTRLQTSSDAGLTIVKGHSGFGYDYPSIDYRISVVASNDWYNRLTVSDTGYGYEVDIFRTIDGVPYNSTLTLYSHDTVVYTATKFGVNDKIWRPYEELDYIVVTSTLNKNYTYEIRHESGGPTDPEQPIIRTGIVTMTDNNGTTITGFNVTAVNRDTDEEYTVSTETDVAVMTLPMDRTIRLRNPQTGEYEDTVVGYYRFYGQATGYKMLSEDGIQVSVVPEKYTSYQLCDIRVTQESGYLTGKHLFQIRSRSDNSILQTGTISAKSATTGNWFNTTVSDGLATLILPYDTSNSISEYAGNYAVYATSPGYQDSEFGTQVVVMPHTVSEIRDVHLTPIGGIPIAGNVTLRIQAFSETGPGVVNAQIFIAGVDGAGESVWDTYTASSTGYLTVSVPGNSTYNIVASGAGYYDSARRVEVFTEDPPLIEIKLYFSGAPTVEPTSQPTGWLTPIPTPTPRPTEVAPNNSPIDNFILMFVNMGFDSAMALWLTGMFLICIASVIGHLIAGKFGAMLGAPVGIVATTGLGLIPFWGMVILLVIAALVIAKMVMR